MIFSCWGFEFPSQCFNAVGWIIGRAPVLYRNLCRLSAKEQNLVGELANIGLYGKRLLKLLLHFD